jgi:DNA-binding NtrC family response regulator
MHEHDEVGPPDGPPTVRLGLIDDDDDFSASLAALVRAEGFDTRTASSLEEARLAIAETRRDVVLVGRRSAPVKLPIFLPPLRDRGDDLELLAQHFLDEMNRREETTKKWTQSGLDALKRRPWRGNVRELRNSVHRAFILADTEPQDALQPLERVSGGGRAAPEPAVRARGGWRAGHDLTPRSLWVAESGAWFRSTQ